MAVRRMLAAAAAWPLLGQGPVQAESLCLASPSPVICPACPATQRCCDVADWLVFSLPGRDAGQPFQMR